MTRFDLPGSVTLADGGGGLPCVRVATTTCAGTVYLLGATVTEWTPAGHEPVLFVSEQSRYAAGQPLRGGVPICAPWFAKGRANDKPLQHGFFRTSPWELVSAQDADGVVTLTFELDVRAAADASGLAAAEAVDIPKGTRATYVVVFGEQLDLALTLHAGEAELDLEEALHTYLRVGDIRQVRLDGLHECRYVDKAPGGRAVNAQSGEVAFTRETDRVYTHAGTVRVVDPAGGRTITVTKEGSGSTVVWNPWEAKAAGLGDLGDEEWAQFVCVESGNALRQSLTVPPGGAHLLRQHLSVAPL